MSAVYSTAQPPGTAQAHSTARSQCTSAAATENDGHEELDSTAPVRSALPALAPGKCSRIEAVGFVPGAAQRAKDLPFALPRQTDLTTRNGEQEVARRDAFHKALEVDRRVLRQVCPEAAKCDEGAAMRVKMRGAYPTAKGVRVVDSVDADGAVCARRDAKMQVWAV